MIPDSVGKRWIGTDPTVHVDVIARHNAAHGGALVTVVKMLKRWNREIGHAFNSLYLELIAMQVFNRVAISSDWSAVRYFLEAGRTRIKTMAADPAGFGGQVNGLDRVRTVAEGVSRFETAYGRALRAERFGASGNVSAAIAEWQKIFGGYFPSYG